MIFYAATSTTPNLEILQGITLVEDFRELFGYKTLDTKEAHFSLNKKPYKNVLRVSFIYIRRSRFENLILNGLEQLFRPT